MNLKQMNKICTVNMLREEMSHSVFKNRKTLKC